MHIEVFFPYLKSTWLKWQEAVCLVENDVMAGISPGTVEKKKKNKQLKFIKKQARGYTYITLSTFW